MAGALGRYPDDDDRAVAKRAMAEALGVDAGRVLLTNGGSEAIALVAQVLGRGWVDEPDFALYGRHLPRLDVHGPRFRSDPHNPTGRLAAEDESAVVWDEAFYPLATGRWTGARGDHGAAVTLRRSCSGRSPKCCAARACGSATWWCPTTTGLRSVTLISWPGLRPANPGGRWPPPRSAHYPISSRVPTRPAGHGPWPRLGPSCGSSSSASGCTLGPRTPTSCWSTGRRGCASAWLPSGWSCATAASFGLPDAVRIAVPDGSGLTRLVDALERTR